MYIRTATAILVLFAFCSMPAHAATKFMGGSPDLSATIGGTNEFVPGQDATIIVVVQNSGLNIVKFVQSGTLEQDDLPNTAKQVTIGLSSGTAPVTVKTDPQMVRDIRATESVTVNFTARIWNNATAGDYQLPLFFHYKYLKVMDQEVSESLQFVYNTVNRTYPVTISIRPVVRIEILGAKPENLAAGKEGYLNFKIKNTGSEDGRKATVRIARSGQSSIVPVDSSVFVGDFPSGTVIDCRYKVSVLDSAEKKIYPVDISVTYENNEGMIAMSAPATAGIPVGGKTDIAVISAPAQIISGSKGVISIQYRNNGGFTLYNAQAHISAVRPFSSNDQSAYLGDVRPGEAATARYEISVDSAAEAKEYWLDSEIRYRDVLDTSQVSETIRFGVQVLPRADTGNLVPAIAALALVTLIAIGAGYYLLVVHKKK